MRPRLDKASIGVSNCVRSERIGDALQRADNAIYEAKSAGRNAVRRQAAA